MKGNVPKRREIAGGSFTGMVMVAPCLLLLGVFAYRPVARSIQLSLYGTDLLGRPTLFIGLANYRDLLSDPATWRALSSTAVIALASFVLATGGALAAALPLRRAAPRARSIASLVLSLPFAYSAAAASAAFAGLLAPAVGTLNQLLSSAGIVGPHWLESRWMAILSISMTTAWYEFGFAFLVLLAALSQVDRSQLEAAGLDGAGEWKIARHIVIPAIRSSLLFLLVTQTVSGLQTFTQVQVLTRGGPADSTVTLVYQLYQRAFGEGLPEYGAASTIGLMLLALVLVVTGVQFWWSRERTR